MGTISCRKFIIAAAGLAFMLSLTSTQGQTLGGPYGRPATTPSPGPDTPTDKPKIRVKGAAEIDAEARAKGRDRKETMVLETAPSKRSTPSPEFAGSLLDAGLPKISNEKESAKTKVESNSQPINANPTQRNSSAARPKQTPSATPTSAQIEVPALSLSINPTPSATISHQP